MPAPSQFLETMFDVNVASYQVSSGDVYLAVRRTLTGTCAVYLGPGYPGRRAIIKDSGYNAAINNITVYPPAGVKVENASSLVINVNGDSVELRYNAATKNYERVMLGSAALAGKASLVGGTVPPAQLPLATTLANGAQSATDKAKQDTQAPGGWASSVANQIAMLVPALTEPFTPVRLAGNPSAWPTGLSDAGVHKGAGQGIAATWIALTESVVVNPAAVPWAVAFLCTFPTPATSGANGAYLALVNSGHASYFGFLSVQAIDGTHLVIQCGNGVGNSRQVTSYVIDGNEHTWILAFDGTNLKVQIDGVLVATIASTNFVSVPTDNFWLGMYNNTANQIKIRAYGWGV